MQGSAMLFEQVTQLVHGQNVAPSCGQQDYGITAEILLTHKKKVALELYLAR